MIRKEQGTYVHFIAGMYLDTEWVNNINDRLIRTRLTSSYFYMTEQP